MTRKTRFLGLVTAAAMCGAPAIFAQETIPPKEQKAPESKPDQTAPIAELIEKLGAEENALRKSAEKELQKLGDAARTALEQAAESHDDPEVRWRARRVLRALDGDAPKLERRPDGGEITTPSPRGGDDLDARMREMMERIERAFGPDLGGLRGFDDIQKQMDELRRRMEALHGAQPGLELHGFGPDAAAEGSRLQIQMGPDGVKVQVEEKGADGKSETKTYEADSLEAFREQYPEVARKYLGGGGKQGFRIFTDQNLPPEWRGFTDITRDPFRSAPVEVVPPPAAPPAPGERLGVYVGDLAPAVRDFLGIPPGQGILVESVEDGSLAASLGIRAKDVVLRVGDRDIADTTDVRTALRGVAKGDKVQVQVNRKGEVLVLEAEKTHDAPADAGKLRKRTDGGDAPPVEKR